MRCCLSPLPTLCFLYLEHHFQLFTGTGVSHGCFNFRSHINNIINYMEVTCIYSRIYICRSHKHWPLLQKLGSDVEDVNDNLHSRRLFRGKHLARGVDSFVEMFFDCQTNELYNLAQEIFKNLHLRNLDFHGDRRPHPNIDLYEIFYHCRIPRRLFDDVWRGLGCCSTHHLYIAHRNDSGLLPFSTLLS